MNDDGKIKVRCRYGLNDESCMQTLDVFDCSKLFIGCITTECIDCSTYLINKKHLIEVK